MVARSRRTVATVAAIGSLALAVVGTVVLTQTANAATGLPYQDASQPVATRVADLLSRMSLDDKVGQMTQASKAALSNQQDIATYRLGSILSGGGEAPGNNSATGWADMYDSYQRTAMS